MPNLQLHQLRVAAVAQIICDNFSEKLDKNTIVTTCLLHDTGNILKSKLDLFPEFLEPQGLKYWQDVKEGFQKKYGTDEVHATLKIAQEVGMDKRVVDLIDGIGFKRSEENYKVDDFERKICGYSDMRVAPLGVLSLLNRLSEGRKRYVENKHARYDESQWEFLSNFWPKIEKQIFEKCSIKPRDINDDSVNPLIKNLKSFEI